MNNQKRISLRFAAICFIANVSVFGMKLSRRHQYPSDCLKDMLSEARSQQKSIQMIGVHDALSAQIFQQQHGLKILQQQQNSKSLSSSLPSLSPMALFVSGFGVSAARLGKPDMSILTRYEQEDTARNIIQSVSSSSTFDPPPVIVDGDTGFGGTANVRETIRRMAAIKAAAITIEDQVFPKKCTYIAGSGINIVSRKDATDRVKTALAAKQEAEEADGNRISIIARTDCRMALGLDEAIERCLAFQKLGADIVYAENLQSKDEYLALRKAMSGGGDVRDLSSMATSDVAPMMLAQFQIGNDDQRLYSVDEVSSMGYEMILYGVAGLQATVSALQSVAAEVFNDDCGGIVTSTPLSSLDQIKDVVGFSDLDSFERKYGCT
uniref:Methylisocitrate lyase n=1 Tax=Pseudo-nitzschia delicatissima TaxID=44447 RepID=A0A7S0T8F5_9STRA|mmetsp:Transcript_1382/g.3192  ORF Transcript_1382/g.3192 Transcript_1382/m.3192 type:complete len:380 (+) Transcript_1382:89-1228(+)